MTKRQDDEDLHTMLAWRLTQNNIKKWREVFLLFAFMIIFLFGAGVVGAFQYYVLCKPKYPQATVQECLSFSVTPKPSPGAKTK